MIEAIEQNECAPSRLVAFDLVTSVNERNRSTYVITAHQNRLAVQLVDIYFLGPGGCK